MTSTPSLTSVAVALFYYHQRIRHEGFDIQWMMHTAGLHAPIPADPQTVPIVAAEPVEPSA